MSGEFQPGGNHLDTSAVGGEIFGHPVGEILVEGHKRVNLPGAKAELPAGLGAVGFGELFQKNVLAGQADDHRHAESAADRPGQTGQEQVRQMDDVWPEFSAEPVEQLGQLLCLPA